MPAGRPPAAQAPRTAAPFGPTSKTATGTSRCRQNRARIAREGAYEQSIPLRPGPPDNWRQVADAVPAFTEPLTIAEWWKNRRGKCDRLVLSQFQGRSIFDLRTWYTADGKLKPGKGFAAEVRHLPGLRPLSPRLKPKRARSA